jgi:hypothetical protein
LVCLPNCQQPKKTFSLLVGLVVVIGIMQEEFFIEVLSF